MSNYVNLQNGSDYVGKAIDKTQTDQILVLDGGNTYSSIGGNLQMFSLGGDSATTVDLQGTGTTDNIQLYGGGNTLDNDGALTGATVNFNAYDYYGYAAPDSVNLTNTGGTTNVTTYASGSSVTLNGDANSTVTTYNGNAKVSVNGDATNTVNAYGGNSSVQIGYTDDDGVGLGHSATVNFDGTNNTVVGGYENFNINGSNSSGSYTDLGSGDSNVSVGGTNNTIKVGGGNNTINAGSDNAKVYLAGVDNSFASTYTADPEDAGVPDDPTDIVTISGANDLVYGTYENAVVNGSAVTSNAQVYMADGNNIVNLGGSGGDIVTLGNGGNSVNASGNGNTVNVGSGANGITLSGNNNTVTVTDPSGTGNDKVKLGTGTGDTVALDHAGGSVTGTGTGTTTVTQSGKNAVTVSLGGGTGNVTLGDGSDTVTANGDGSSITLGNGKTDTVTANGKGDTITLGNGNDTVTANGSGDNITLGKGNNNVTANGGSDTLAFGKGNNTVTANGANDTFTFGGGSNAVTATGAGDTLTFTGVASKSTDTLSLGASATVNVDGGTLNVSTKGAYDTFNLSGISNASKISATGNNETFNLSNNAGGAFTLGGAATGDAFVFKPGSGGSYTGAVTVSSFQVGDTMNLDGLTDAKGFTFTASNTTADYAELKSDLLAGASGGGETLSLKGGGSVTFVAMTGTNKNEFIF